MNVLTFLQHSRHVAGPAPVTSAEPNKAVPVASQIVSPTDFGRFMGIEMADDQKMAALTDRWDPYRKQDFPVSYHKKQEVTHPCRLRGTT